MEKILGNDNGIINSISEHNSEKECIEKANKDLKGEFLGAPTFEHYPRAYIIKGEKTLLQIHKTFKKGE